MRPTQKPLPDMYVDPLLGPRRCGLASIWASTHKQPDGAQESPIVRLLLTPWCKSAHHQNSWRRGLPNMRGWRDFTTTHATSDWDFLAHIPLLPRYSFVIRDYWLAYSHARPDQPSVTTGSFSTATASMSPENDLDAALRFPEYTLSRRSWAALLADLRRSNNNKRAWDQ